jgi:radical SAM/Cys-rich protein
MRSSAQDEIVNDFERKVHEATGSFPKADGIETLQVNIGLRCNSQCSHCHVQASRVRNETMNWSIMELIINKAHTMKPSLIDITGGAPELNPYLRDFVKTLRENEHKVQVRTNLTILSETGMETMIEFYHDNQVKLAASLPCYLRKEVDSVRGDGTFNKSIEVLKRLNEVGYGLDPKLELDLVFNPEGAFLPPDQSTLEHEYQSELDERFGIVFNRLIAIANKPVGRFSQLVHRQNVYEEYSQLLRESFNPKTLEGLMCRHQIDVGWDGTIYDCDFNLGLRLPVGYGFPSHLDAFDFAKLSHRRILTGNHCFGCTAGNGSSCEGALAK